MFASTSGYLCGQLTCAWQTHNSPQVNSQAWALLGITVHWRKENEVWGRGRAGGPQGGPGFRFTASRGGILGLRPWFLGDEPASGSAGEGGDLQRSAGAHDRCPADCGTERETPGLLTDLGAWWVCHHCPRCHLGRSLGVVLPCPSNPAARAKAMLSVSLFSRPLCCSATGVRVVVLSKRAWEWGRRCPLPWMNGYPGAFPFRTGTWVLHGGTPGISVPPDRDLLG